MTKEKVMESLPGETVVCTMASGAMENSTVRVLLSSQREPAELESGSQAGTSSGLMTKPHEFRTKNILVY